VIDRVRISHLLATAFGAALAFPAGIVAGGRAPTAPPSATALAPAPRARPAEASARPRSPESRPPLLAPYPRVPLGSLSASAIAPAAWIDDLPLDDERVVALGTRLLIALGRGEQAAWLLLGGPPRSSELDVEVALALETQGRRDLAKKIAADRFASDPRAEECFALLLRLDAPGALRAVELWQTRLPAEFASDYSLAELRAQALCSLGRAREAAVDARPLDEFVEFRASGSFRRTRAADWEWEAVAAAWPARTEDLLRRMLENSARPDPATVMRLGELLKREGRVAELEQLFECCRPRAERDDELAMALARLLPSQGWELVIDAWNEAPEDEQLALPLARHLREQGQPGRAAAVLAGLIEARWDDAELVAEAVALDAGALLPLIRRRARELAAALPADFEDGSQLDEALGDLGDLHWRLGRRGQALDLWRRARALDPADSEWFESLRRAEVGLDPLHW
jgi:tetratricopeptide (TPR) repeat protein